MNLLISIICLLQLCFVIKIEGLTKCPFKGYNDWSTRDNRTCYLFKLTSNRSEERSWHDAESHCLSLGGHLTSLHDIDETTFIANVSYSLSYNFNLRYSFWIGLNCLEKRGDFHWSDGTLLDYTPQVPWNDSTGGVTTMRPETTTQWNINSGRCVYMKVANQYHSGKWYKFGLWYHDNCNENYPYVCKKMFINGDSNASVTTTPSTNTAPPNKGCELGWYQSGQKCLYPTTEPHNQSYAKTQCMAMNAELLSIHSAEEQNFITAIMSRINQTVWIGLKMAQNGRGWRWDDESPLTFTNWASDEPLKYSYMKNCVQMQSDINQAGKWSVASCDTKHIAICHKKTSVPIEDSSLPVFVQCDRFPNFKCWKYRNSYYQFNFERNSYYSWGSAEQFCEYQNAHIVSIIDPYEAAFINYMVLHYYKNTDQFWIGMFTKNPGGANASSELVFEWSDLWPVYYTNWDQHQPGVNSTESMQCVSQNSKNLKWTLNECNQIKPFICKATDNAMPVPNNYRNGHCPSVKFVDHNPVLKWVNIDKRSQNCYWFSIDAPFIGRMSWYDAEFYCHRRGGKLLSIHSDHDLKLMRPKVTLGSAPTWIGLYQSLEGTFQWDDESPLDYSDWKDNEPSLSPNQFCVEMSPKDMRWNDNRCTKTENYFICQIKKVSALPLVENHPPSSRGNTIPIVAGCTVVIIIVGICIGIYYYSKKRQNLDPNWSFGNFLYKSIRGQRSVETEHETPQQITSLHSSPGTSSNSFNYEIKEKNQLKMMRVP